MAQVFVSHAHSEEALAGKVAKLLGDALGLTPSDFFLSSQVGHGVAPSASIRASIVSELRSVPALVVLLTPKAAASPWVWLEAGNRLGSADKSAPIFIVPSVRFVPLLAPVADLRCLHLDNDGELHELVKSVGRNLARPPLDFLNYKPALDDVVHCAASTYSLARERRTRAISWLRGHAVALLMLAAGLGMLGYGGWIASATRAGQASHSPDAESVTLQINEELARTASRYLKLKGTVTSPRGPVYGAAVMVASNEVRNPDACQEPGCTKDTTTTEGEFMIDLTKIRANNGDRLVLTTVTEEWEGMSRALEVDVRATDQGNAPQVIQLAARAHPSGRGK